MTASRSQPSALRRFFGGLGRFFTGTRNFVLNTIFIIFLVVVLVAIFSDTGLNIDTSTTLVVAPTGMLVEQHSLTPADLVVNQMLGAEDMETRMRDLVAAIQAASEDKRISALLIYPQEMLGADLAKLQELSSAIEDFKLSGKPVIAYAEYMDDSQYYLASLADEVLLHPEGGVLLEGFAAYRNYFNQALQKLGVNVHLFRVGQYKSAAEPFIRDSMSQEARQAISDWLGDLWQIWLADTAPRRDMEPAALEQLVNQQDRLLQEAGGDSAQMALATGLVDQLADREALRDRMRQLGAWDDGINSFRQVDVDGYVSLLKPRLIAPLADKVAVVVAQGAIVPGEATPADSGAENVARRLRQARFDPQTRAIVLRVDSPGGAVMASELIRREVVAARAAGKPVTVSMSGVAASGGYWISMNADAIVAHPATITGSIGIYGLWLTIPEGLNQLGIHTDGVGTTPFAGTLRPDLPLDESTARLIQASIEDGYEDFITKVAQAREMTLENVDEIAQGRVWSGADALHLGLVDALGGLPLATTTAAELAGLEDYEMYYVEPELTAFERFLLEWSANALASAGVAVGGAQAPAWLGWLQGTLADLRLLTHRDPLGAYAYCFCQVR